jgi:hypothetical protein
MDQRIESTGDWQQDWSVIDAFVRDWLGFAWQRQPDLARVQELERQVAVQLPAAAREWCYFAWSAAQLGRSFSFRDEFVVERLKDHDAVSLLLQGEADFYWAIETPLLADDDPAVTAYALNYEQPDSRFGVHGLWSPSVSAFAFDYLLTYLHTPGGGAAAPTSAASFDRDLLSADLGEPFTFGHLEGYLHGGVLIFTSHYADNWHHDTVTIRVQQKTPLRKLPPSVQRLIQDAHALEGALANRW